jgi:small subunit ribosomal protein S21e
MQNEDGVNVDLYVPRKCSWTNRLVRAKDHASVQINVANVDTVTGMATGHSTAYCLNGYIRFKSEGDMALTELVRKKDMEMMSEGAASGVAPESA